MSFITSIPFFNAIKTQLYYNTYQQIFFSENSLGTSSYTSGKHNAAADGIDNETGFSCASTESNIPTQEGQYVTLTKQDIYKSALL